MGVSETVRTVFRLRGFKGREKGKLFCFVIDVVRPAGMYGSLRTAKSVVDCVSNVLGTLSRRTGAAPEICCSCGRPLPWHFLGYVGSTRSCGLLRALASPGRCTARQKLRGSIEPLALQTWFPRRVNSSEVLYPCNAGRVPGGGFVCRQRLPSLDS